eukprot:TRINITY_DN556_c0_g2_i11.p1 TRINITY_DN556_c0_g2~~TRINITY_DN556_c0_g2_i11.p1  ORF type:complete len:106 (+),score=0.55 TRINITY_DN556_c0_g2_i11:154-471(+)
MRLGGKQPEFIFVPEIFKDMREYRSPNDFGNLPCRLFPSRFREIKPFKSPISSGKTPDNPDRCIAVIVAVRFPINHKHFNPDQGKPHAVSLTRFLSSQVHSGGRP